MLKVDGEIGNKKVYDPRSYLKAAEKGMAGVLPRLAPIFAPMGKPSSETFRE